METHEETKSNNNTSPKPLLLLDFDDVLNIPLGKPLKPTSDYKWRRKSEWDYDAWHSSKYLNIDDNEKFIITINDEMIDALKSLEDRNLCEIVWLSTWTEHAGRPHPLITAEDIEKVGHSGNTGGSSLLHHYEFLTKLIGRSWRAAGGGGARIPGYHIAAHEMRWWKWDAVLKVRRLGHPVIFADDILFRRGKSYKEEEQKDADLKLIRVNHDRGFQKKDFRDIEEWLIQKAGDSSTENP